MIRVKWTFCIDRGTEAYKDGAKADAENGENGRNGENEENEENGENGENGENEENGENGEDASTSDDKQSKVNAEINTQIMLTYL